MEELQRKQLREALVQAALLESKALSVGFAEMIAYLQKNEHMPALGAFLGLEEHFTFLGTVLETAARLA
jgi:hypothetical protein